MPKGDKTVARSFRISQRAFDSLQKEASRKKISINTLVNQLFLAYEEFDRFYERMGMAKISTATFQRLLTAASQEEVINAARQAGEDTPRAIIISRDGLVSLTTIINFLKSMSEYANWFEYNEVDAGKKIITLMHALGPNGSLFLTHYVRAIFEGIGLSPKFSSSEHSVIIDLGATP